MGEALFWIIVALIWVIVQTVKWSRKQQEQQQQQRLQPPRATPAPLQPPPSRQPQQPLEDELAAFLESLTGTQPKPQPPAPKPPPLQTPHRVTVQRREGWPKRGPYARPRPPDPEPVPRKPAPPPPPPIEFPRAVAGDLTQAGAVGSIADMASSIGKMSTSSGFARTQKLLSNVGGLTTPTMSLSGATTRRTGASLYRPEWSSTDDLKRAIVGHIILGPPPSLQPGGSGAPGDRF